MLMRNLSRLLCVFWLLLSVVFAESLDETRKKAEAGDAIAQGNLGLMYANGDVISYLCGIKLVRLSGWRASIFLSSA